MEGPKNGESGKESPPQKIDPTSFRDALGTFFKPTKTGEPLADFYTVYRREASEYDVEYVKKYSEDLDTTLIFAGLFSAVSSAFIIDIYKQLQPDTSDQTAALLRAILLTLNHSAIPSETLTDPTVQQNPPSEIVIVNCLLFASLLISLLAAFAAMLGKQWLNRYSRHAGGSMIDRCGDRQRKFDGLQRWKLHFIIESLPVMLQIALLLLACGLCRYIMTINTPVASTLITLTGFGVLFYVVVVIAGASSDDCPFQTPGSALLRSSWKTLKPHLIPIPLIAHTLLLTLLEGIQLVILLCICPCRRRAHAQPPVWVGPPEPLLWFAPNELAMVQKKNFDNVRCVSWVLRDITDPEALDVAI